LAQGGVVAGTTSVWTLTTRRLRGHSAASPEPPA
jgi:hypothetical protein